MKLSDEQLLERFLKNRDELAFELLVNRYSSLVLGVCRHQLGNSPEAEKAFQATFVALVKKDSDVSKAHLQIGSWLYETSVRNASALEPQENRGPTKITQTHIDELVRTTVKAAAATLVGIEASIISFLFFRTIKNDLIKTFSNHPILAPAVFLVSIATIVTFFAYQTHIKKQKGANIAMNMRDLSMDTNDGPKLDEMELPKSVSEYMEKFEEAIDTENKIDRWQKLRSLGINLSNQDYLKAETQGFQSWLETLREKNVPQKDSTTSTTIDSSNTHKTERAKDHQTHDRHFLKDRYYHAAIFSQWIQSAPESAASWAYRLQTLPDDYEHELPTYTVNQNHSIAVSPTKLNNHQSDSPSQVALLHHVVAQWSVQNKDAALKWAEKLPQGRARDAAMTAIDPLMKSP